MSELLSLSSSPSPTFVSFGYRCSAAGILKKLGLKHESFPFDWMISRLDVVSHAIGDDDFAAFMSAENYVPVHSNTYARTHDITDQRVVCDEYLQINRVYGRDFVRRDAGELTSTYTYRCATNHHNITCSEGAAYYARCVERWRAMMLAAACGGQPNIIYLHISPVYFVADFREQRTQLFAEIVRVNRALVAKTGMDARGLVFFLVDAACGGGEAAETSASMYELTVDGVDVCSDDDNDNVYLRMSKIYIVNVNAGFIDAGEIFMGDCAREEEFICGIVREVAAGDVMTW